MRRNGTNQDMTGREKDHGGELRVAVANIEFGGLSPAGDDSAWRQSVACLAGLGTRCRAASGSERPGTVPAARAPVAHRERAGHDPRPRPAQPRVGVGQPPGRAGPHRRRAAHPGRRPPPGPAAGAEAAWCEARVSVPGIPHPVWFTSVHLPPKSGTSQRIHAERLACLNASRGGLVIVGGDWNSYAPADPITPRRPGTAPGPPAARPDAPRPRRHPGTGLPRPPGTNRHRAGRRRRRAAPPSTAPRRS